MSCSGPATNPKARKDSFLAAYQPRESVFFSFFLLILGIPVPKPQLYH